MPRGLRTMTVEPTDNWRGRWIAAPYLFRLVALAGIVNGFFWVSSPDSPTEVFRAIRLLRRFAICARLVDMVCIRLLQDPFRKWRKYHSSADLTSLE